MTSLIDIKESRSKLSKNQLDLGKTYYSDVSVEENCVIAFKFTSRSAEQGNAEAQFILGNLYALGHGTKKNHEKAYMWYTKSAIQGYKKALIRIHNLYQEDIGVHCRGQLNSDESEWNTDEFKQANQVRELNEYRLKQMQPLLNGAIEYYTDQFKKCQTSNQEDPETQQNLGFLYQHGYGVKKATRWAIEYYTKAAEKGLVDAQYNLGYLYQHNTDIKFNYRKAFRWYEEAAEGGNIAAQNRLAYFYEKGLAVNTDNQLAISWYTNAANSGSSEAQLALGKIFRKLQDGSKTNSEATKWYLIAAQHGNRVAQNCLHQSDQQGETSHFKYNDGKSPQYTDFSTKERLCSKLREDIEKVDTTTSNISHLKILAQHALVGDGNAMYNIGLKYYEGIDFSKDKYVSLRWIKNSAKAGFKKAQLKLAEMYETGDATEQNYHKASLWIKHGARQRDHAFQCRLGILYAKGHGVRQDYLESSKWFILSADRGNSTAQYHLGVQLYSGKGVRENRDQAYKTFFNSARQGNIEALYELGKMHISGETDKEEKNLAMRMLNYAANHKNTDAQLQLGRMYEDGSITHKDLSKANNYYKMIIDSGSGQGQYEMALKYLKGEFFHSNYAESFRLFKLAEKKGFLKAKNLLGFPMVDQGKELDGSLILEMFISVSRYGAESMEFNIGFFYEVNQNYSTSIQWYLEATKKGDGRALYRLGIIYEVGKGVSSNLKMAIGYYEKAIEKKEVGAIYRLGCLYLDGRGVKKDLMRAFQLYTEASNSNHNESRKVLMLPEIKANQNKPVLNYGQEDPVKIDKRHQIDMLEIVAKLNDVAVQYRLSLFYERNGNPRAIDWLVHLSRQGILDAYYRLGRCYEEGRGVRQDFSKAVKLYQEAIKGNNENAMHKLAKMYYFGKGVELNFLKAYNLYIMAEKLGYNLPDTIMDINHISIMRSTEKTSEKVARLLKMYTFVADKGNIDLQYKIGSFYEYSTAYKNHLQSLKWYTKAFKKEHKDSTYKLGQFYEEGLGVERDYEKSIEFYVQAKNLGSVDALFKLGMAYHKGYGVTKDSVTAIDYYVKAAKNGQLESQYTLGKLYETGELVGEKDLLEAIAWYTRASLQGHEKSIDQLYTIYDHEPYETYFYEKLFQILLKCGRSEKKEDKKYYAIFGSMLYKLGYLYNNGKGTPRSLGKALQCFSDSFYIYNYSGGELYSLLELGGITSSSEFLDNLESYWEIKEGLNATHQYDLGIYYYGEACRCAELLNEPRIDNSTSINSVAVSRAITYFTLSAFNRNKKAQDKLIGIYLEDKLVPQQLTKIMDLHETFARKSLTHECYIRGIEYFDGNGVNQDYNISLIYLNEAAKRGDSKAKIKLGDMYLNGLGLELNYLKAKKWYDSSTQKMSAFDCYHMGEKYADLNNLDNRGEISFLYFQKAAEKGDSNAQVRLADMYLEGVGVIRDYMKALFWYEKSTREMTKEDCYTQGERFFKNNSDKIQYKVAQIFFKEAASKGNVNGDYKLGEIYFEGHGLEKKDFLESLKHYRKAAEKGITDAQCRLADMYLKGHGTTENFELALKWYRSSTEKMTDDECWIRGKEFLQDESVNRNTEISYIYIKASAEKGHSEAALMLGEMYVKGTGTEKNHEEAYKWYDVYAKKIDFGECYGLGNKYYTGDEVEENHEIAFIYYIEAAEKGHCNAQIKVGDMYLHGDGIAANPSSALDWYTKSTEKMSDTRCCSLGHKFFTEHSGLRINEEISFMYFKAAFEKGNNDVHNKLGYMYLEGVGVDKNLQKSFEHYKKALDLGDNNSQVHLDFLYSIGVGNSPSDEEIKNYHEKHVKNMKASEQYQEGKKFYIGDGVTVNYEVARLYFSEAAKKGYHKAYTKLGEIYSEGYGTKIHNDTARYWFTLYAKEITPEECLVQAKNCYEGRASDKNYVASFSYYERAAENGIIEAQTVLGDMYCRGLGIEENQETAFKWYRRSARNMSQEDSYKYGKKLFDQKSDNPDLTRQISLLFLEESAKAGYFQAQAMLGDVYLHGLGFERNTEKALEWYKNSVSEMGSEESYSRGIKAYDDVEQDISHTISLIFLKGAANKGNRKAHAKLGDKYFTGDGVPQNLNDSFFHYTIAANNGHSKSQARLGDMYLQQTENEAAYQMAKDWYEKSAENMHSYACYERGEKFFTGKDIKKDYNIARIFFEKAAKTGNIKARTKIGLMYFNGFGLEENHVEAFKNYQDSAEKNDVEAQIQLANMYSQGLGVKKNIEEALKWCKTSVRVLGAYECQEIARSFTNNNGANKNENLALFYFMTAADKGSKIAREILNVTFNQHRKIYPLDGLPIDAHDIATIQMTAYDCYSQGRNFFEGNGVNVDHKIALLYFRKAAEKGYLKASTRLGDMYLQGFGINSDLKEALKWYKISASEMSPADCYIWGEKFRENADTKGNHEVSFIYFKEAAEKGYSEAYTIVGEMYFRGRGVEINENAALYYYNKAAEKGDFDAKAKVQNIKAQLIETESNHNLDLKPDDSNAKPMTAYDYYLKGKKYIDGADVNFHFENACKCFTRAADGGYSDAFVELGNLHLEGRGTVIDNDLAKEMYENSIENMEIADCYNHGERFFNKDGEIKLHYEISLIFFEKAAENGHINARVKLGKMYYKGLGVDIDYVVSFKHYKIAAENGNTQAQRILGRMYHHGTGVEKDIDKALHWYALGSSFSDNSN